MDEVRILATCSIGLGYSVRGLKAGLALEPHAVAADSGSSDFGPYYLGTGLLQKSPVGIRRDMEMLINGALDLGVPFMTGSAGGAGGDPQLDEVIGIVREIAADGGRPMKVARISSRIPAELLKRKVREKKVRPLGDLPELTEADVNRLEAAVGLVGAEPFLDALDAGANVLVAGRACNPAIFVGPALRAGKPASQSWHAAKTIDKGYLATTRPQDGSPVLVRIHDDHFTVEPTKDDACCTVASVASLTLHENPNPFEVTQPTGTIDTHESRYEQIDERRVRVSGSRFIEAPSPTIKVEGAALVGYRYILIAGIRDPRTIERLDEFLDGFRDLIRRQTRGMQIAEADYHLQFRVYGRDAVMGALEPLASQPGHEVGLIMDVVGRTDEIGRAVATKLGPTGSRLDVSGRQGGGGNFAYPFSPSLIRVGPAYKWGAWHVFDTDDREMRELFRPQLIEMGGRA